MSYYGIAKRGSKYGIVAVTVTKGRTAQEWTGEEFATQGQAEDRMTALNSDLFGVDLAAGR
jgi:hypothetical protein